MIGVRPCLSSAFHYERRHRSVISPFSRSDQFVCPLALVIAAWVDNLSRSSFLPFLVFFRLILSSSILFFARWWMPLDSDPPLIHSRSRRYPRDNECQPFDERHRSSLTLSLISRVVIRRICGKRSEKCSTERSFEGTGQMDNNPTRKSDEVHQWRQRNPLKNWRGCRKNIFRRGGGC